MGELKKKIKECALVYLRALPFIIYAMFFVFGWGAITTVDNISMDEAPLRYWPLYAWIGLGALVVAPVWKNLVDWLFRKKKRGPPK